jgi:methionine-rich copper-binding protein CopC
MPPVRPRGARRPIIATAVPAMLALVGVVLTPTSGWAAGRLVSADPSDGSALSAPPPAVVLIFSAPPDPGLSHVSTQDALGTQVAAGGPSRSGRAGLRLPISIRSAGDYTVAYHVVFDDGSDLTGFLRFSVGTGLPPSPRTAPGQSTVADSHAHGIDPLGGALLLADLLVMVAVCLLLLPRPGRRR